MTTPNPPQPITIRLPSKYSTSSSSTSSTTSSFTPPSLSFLRRTWSVTHSTLKMWRSARNVRITYGSLPPSTSPSTKKGSGNGNGNRRECLSDTVEYEALSGSGRVKRVLGTDTAAAGVEEGKQGGTGAWDWRGSGWLFFVSSHWEVLGWGERREQGLGPNGEEEEVVAERWVVTWFAPTLFTAEGIDVYSDRKEGGSAALVRDVLAELGKVCEGKGKLGEIVAREMKEVAIRLPWKES
ncbi:hypothetical protein C7999DRAFT_14976 [Corynascus novoguineensis]|uniref:Uncharacterized protein n=1 Tax=Corynascus novoguineensis TaxID=1126955 RepID=A0AAN7HEU3_9PEZI|nr:hypothetical protein C7999DRAFT_14976 [Corynascus novoguineensis]